MKYSFQHPFGERTPFPPPPHSTPSDGHGLAVASLVLGILSVVFFCCAWALLPIPLICSVLAIVFSAVSRRLSRRFSGQAIAGLILGILSLTLTVLLFSAIVWLLSIDATTLRELFGEEFAQAFIE